MIHKFKFTKLSGTIIMADAVRERRSALLRSLGDGDYEILIRPELKWDTDQMRKYFHGPVLKFIVEQFKVLGHIYTRDEIKECMKRLFGPGQFVKELNTHIPKSTAEYDFATYTKFLKDINDWCIEVFQFELPTAEEVE